jgi:hypothetical protein
VKVTESNAYPFRKLMMEQAITGLPPNHMGRVAACFGRDSFGTQSRWLRWRRNLSTYDLRESRGLAKVGVNLEHLGRNRARHDFLADGPGGLSGPRIVTGRGVQSMEQSNSIGFDVEAARDSPKTEELVGRH